MGIVVVWGYMGIVVGWGVYGNSGGVWGGVYGKSGGVGRYMGIIL